MQQVPVPEQGFLYWGHSWKKGKGCKHSVVRCVYVSVCMSMYLIHTCVGQNWGIECPGSEMLEMVVSCHEGAGN